jgi:hypothetical protein
MIDQGMTAQAADVCEQASPVARAKHCFQIAACGGENNDAARSDPRKPQWDRKSTVSMS